MIGYLRGTVDQLLSETCYLDVRGVGYRVYIPASTREKLQTGAETKLFTYLNVREDALHLFGFITLEEHDMFLLLLTVTGVGPKMALAMLSGMKPDGIRAAISRNDLASLTRISGVGKKTAERIVLELRDKIGQIGLTAELPTGKESGQSGVGGAFDEALAALMALGYQRAEILPLLRSHMADKTTAEALIRAVLREIGRR